ncbi:MAG: DNA cytosine methyltransferase [Sphaerospermopsis kisseleviana]
MINPIAWFLKDLESVPKNGLKVMSTFSCGGGSSLGYKLAGCDVIAANDIDPEMAYHYKLNLKPKHYFLCPIKHLLNKELPNELYHLDILDGSPPCSTFSMSGNREKDWGKKKHFREGQAKQVLDDLFFDYLNLVERLKPKVAIAENVKGLLQGNAKGYCKLIINRFREIGYKPQLFLINAADCGVPQKRERVFFIALRDDIYKPKLVLAPKHRWISAGEATNDIQDLTDDEIKYTAPQPNDLKCWPHTIKGDAYSTFLKKTENRDSCFNNIRINDCAPSNTLTSKPGTLNHWDVCRRLTYREYKRLGSFPDDYQAKTDRIGKYIIGMSVPPRMTEQVAKAVIEQWF